MYDRDGSVLLLGVGHEVDSSLHLAEYRADLDVESVDHRAPVLRDGAVETVGYDDIAIRTEGFDALGAAFERDVGAETGAIGAGSATVLDQPTLGDYAVDWLESHR